MAALQVHVEQAHRLHPPNFSRVDGRGAVMAAAMFLGVDAEIQDGIVQHKWGGMSVRTADPFWFWLDVALQMAMGVFFTGLSLFGGYLGFRRRP